MGADISSQERQTAAAMIPRETRMFSRISMTGVIVGLCLVLLACPLPAFANTDIRNTRHNLSKSAPPGSYKSEVETRICVFCHTPHNASPSTPLWNKDLTLLEGNNYDPYASSTLHFPGKTTPPPTGPSRLCLSCHDGTIALGAVLNPAGGLSIAGKITSGPGFIGTDLSKDHPVSFSYNYIVSQAPQEFVTPAPPDLLFYGYDAAIHCSTCHDPHDDTNGKFLRVDSKGSNLCAQCHLKEGWNLSPHKNSTASLPAPLPGMEWTQTLQSPWTTVADYGCEGCHRPHFAGGKKRLLRQSAEEENCYPCHNGTVSSRDIERQLKTKTYNHPVGTYLGLHDPTESPVQLAGHVECQDCHNAHAANDTTALPPAVSGKLQKVSGVKSDGLTPVFPALNEYEICFKCHAATAPQIFASGYVPIRRVVSTFDKSAQFKTSNVSYMPVEDSGKNSDVPSLKSPGADPDTPLYLNVAGKIYCSDCHSDDAGSVGPHGSNFAPLLKKRYETVVGTQESEQNYALCYRCHDRINILSNMSFQKNLPLNAGGHSGHLLSPLEGKPVPCSVCHDPHGVPPLTGSGDHTRLINFDVAVVGPGAGNSQPLFTDNGQGSRSGSCTLVCHFSDGTSKIHTNASYP
jgi:predicted CXXCH cytochrome family protein